MHHVHTLLHPPCIGEDALLLNFMFFRGILWYDCAQSKWSLSKCTEMFQE
jgi:hypothetical protein